MWRRPLWAEGLFVSQHHFQAQDRYHEGLLRERISAIRRFDWGITALEIDERLLASGQFGLRRLTAIWPDGLVVRCGGPSGERLPDPRSFDGHFTGDAGPLDVLVGVGAEGGGNVPLAGEPIGAQRFSRLTASTEDLDTGAGAQEVEYLAPNVRVVFGTERTDGLVTIPIAQLVRRSDGRVVVRDAFVPPVLDIAAAPFVTSELRRLLGAMVARQRELAAARKQRSPSTIEFHQTDARAFSLLYTLSGAVPELSHLLDAERSHPEEVYLALAQLVGRLSAFSADAEPERIPPFDYRRLGETFAPLFARVLALLSIDAAPAFTEIPLQRRPDGMFLGRMPDARLDNHELFVAVSGSPPESSVRDRIPQMLKIASWRQIADVVKQARHGVVVDVDWHPSSALPLKPGVCFFKVRREGPFWGEIAKTSTVALYLPGDADWKDASLAVYAVDRAYLS